MKMNGHYALSIQERANNSNFLKAVEEVTKANLGNIDLVATASLNTDDTVVFMDGSKCKFEGHNIVLID